MTTVTFSIPCLVQQFPQDGNETYLVRPLFRTQPASIHPQFDQALEDIRLRLRQYLDNWQLSTDQRDRYLWFAFDPAVESYKADIEVVVNKRPYRGTFSLYTFTLQGLQLGLLPAFNHYLYLIDVSGQRSRDQQLLDLIEKLLQREAGRTDREFDFERFTIPRKEFITHLDIETRVKPADFSFMQAPELNFSLLFGGGGEFTGSEEIRKVAESLHQQYPYQLSRSYFRDKEAEQLKAFLADSRADPLVIVGPEGSGRHTLVEEAVYRYLQEEKEADQTGRPIWLLDPNQVIAGMSYIGWWERRFESVLEHMAQVQPLPAVMVVDNPLALLRIGRTSQSSLNLAGLLRPYLEKRRIPALLIATEAQWKLLQEQDGAFARQFRVYRLEPTDTETSVHIALRKRRWLEKKYNTRISIPAIQELFRLHRNYFHEHALPGYIMRQMEQLVKRDPFGYIDLPQVRKAFSNQSGWRDQVFSQDQTLSEGEIESRIASELIGQEEAVKALSGAVHLVRSRLTDTTRPYGSFLFVGPTGVGKTQAAKVLCRFLTGSEKNLLRFDMNEFIDGSAAQRLIGTFRQPEGLLTSRVRFQPFSVLLFDEVEKADPSVMDLLLQVLDDGRLTDSRGRLVDFTNTFIILTSNLGSREAAGRLGFRSEKWDDGDAYVKALSNHFRPEFLNRIDHTVIFRPLSAEEILFIARLQIRELLSRDGFVRRTTLLNIHPEALEWVARRGYDPAMGGRALKRQIERDLTRLSAEQLVRMYEDHPILMDIRLADGQLVPEITRLEFVPPNPSDWEPALPDERRGSSFYRRLLDRLDQLEKQVQHTEPDVGTPLLDVNTASENWQYYHFRNRISESREKIQTLLLGHRDPHFREAPPPAFRFRSGAFPEVPEEGFRAEQLAEFREQYRLGQQHYNSPESEFLDQYIAVEQLETCGRYFLQQPADRVTLHIEATINMADESPLDYLYEQYRAWLERMEVQHEADPGGRILQAEEFGLAEMLAPETGLHFFYGPFGTPVPVRVRLDAENVPDGRNNGRRIVRIYDRQNTLIDLRTGFASDYYSTAAEWNVLIYAGSFG